MKVVFVASRSKVQYPDLTDGKQYEVVDEDVIDGVPCFFIVDDDGESDLGYEYPYEQSIFEKVAA